MENIFISKSMNKNNSNPLIEKEILNYFNYEKDFFKPSLISNYHISPINEKFIKRNTISNSKINYQIVNNKRQNCYDIFSYEFDNKNLKYLNYVDISDNLYNAEKKVLELFKKDFPEKNFVIENNNYFHKLQGEEFKYHECIPIYSLGKLYDNLDIYENLNNEDEINIEKFMKKNKFTYLLQHDDSSYFSSNPAFGLPTDCVDCLFETENFELIQKIEKGFSIKNNFEPSGYLNFLNAEEQLAVNSDMIFAEYSNGMNDSPEDYPIFNRTQALNYAYSQIYDRLDDYNGNTLYGENIADYLKYIDSNVSDKIILEKADENNTYNLSNEEEKKITYLTDNNIYKISEGNSNTLFNYNDNQNGALRNFNPINENIIECYDETKLLNDLKKLNIEFKKEDRKNENILFRKITYEETNHKINFEKTKQTGSLSISSDLKKIPTDKQKIIAIYVDKRNNELYPGKILENNIPVNVSSYYIENYTRPITEINKKNILKFYYEKEKNLNKINIKTDLNEPNLIGKGYKVFLLKDGKLYPPMVAMPGRKDVPIGKWIEASIGEKAESTKTGKPRTKTGGKGVGTNNIGSVSLKPGFHIADLPYCTNFNHNNPLTNEEHTLFPNNYVYAEVEFSKDINYQDKSSNMDSIPKNGFYKYITNTITESKTEWNISGKMKVNKILSRKEVEKIQDENGLPHHQYEEDFIDAITIKKLQEKIEFLKKQNKVFKKSHNEIIKNKPLFKLTILNNELSSTLSIEQKQKIINKAYSMAEKFKIENENNKNNKQVGEKKHER